ncbi:DUF1534 domain-containing protein [Pseudomonas tremae]|nr:DUF1534 domain-containing protein [Pseudomonas tremae]MCF5808983.1 DUF1534 domain-containing protein [Pseudomonas tremae]
MAGLNRSKAERKGLARQLKNSFRMLQRGNAVHDALRRKGTQSIGTSVMV